MNKQLSCAITTLLIAHGAAATTADPQTPADSLPASELAGWKIEFSDEFNATSLDLSKWVKDESEKTRTPRWDRGIADWWFTPDNVSLDGNNLVLAVTKEDHNTMRTGSVSSINLYEPTYGYFEARIEIADSSKDTHTAFWLQGQNQGNVDGTGNDGAEIDIFESAWVTDTTKSVVHIDGYGTDHKANTVGYNTPGIHSGYHTFGLEWNEHVMNIYYDGVLKSQYEGKWVPKVAEFLWLSDGASFGDIGSFTSEPVGHLTSAKFDYVRAWQPLASADLTLVGGNKMNGNFNAESGGAVTYLKTGGWHNLAGDQFQKATNNNASFDGSQNLMINISRLPTLNTGYSMVEGDTFDFSYVWKDDWSWVDASDQVKVTLFTTSDNTLAGEQNILSETFSDISSKNDIYQLVDSDNVYTATEADIGKSLFVTIHGLSDGFGRLDNFELTRHNPNTAKHAPKFTSSPINLDDALIDEVYTVNIASFAEDEDGDLLTFSLTSPADWVTLTSDGNLTGTPTQAGSYSWEVEVSDGYESDITTINLTVNPPAIPTVIFSDDFESKELDAWKVDGLTEIKRRAHFDGKRGVTLKKFSVMDAFISTAGYQNMMLSYARSAVQLEGDENLRVRWKVQGTDNWNDLEILNTTDYSTHTVNLPAAADDTNIVIRFVTNASKKKEKAYIDDVVLKGFEK